MLNYQTNPKEYHFRQFKCNIEICEKQQWFTLWIVAAFFRWNQSSQDLMLFQMIPNVIILDLNISSSTDRQLEIKELNSRELLHTLSSFYSDPFETFNFNRTPWVAFLNRLSQSTEWFVSSMFIMFGQCSFLSILY